MAYEKPITIKEAIGSIADDEYVLPAIQREFVWKTEQIETLFDSLLRDYPISTFLFWKVSAQNVAKFKFYRFLKNYHERDERHNQEASLSGKNDIIAILDGQQRLTSIYVGLLGSYASRKRYHKVSSDHAYPSKKLYLNLLQEAQDIGKEYDFRFLTEEEAAVRDEQNFWVSAGKVLEMKEYEDASDWVNDELEDLSHEFENPLDKEIKKAGRRRFCTLYRGEAGVVTRFRSFVTSEPHCFERSLLIGHVTGSAWVIDPTGSQTLLTHHAKLERWLQLGGHADGDPDVAAVALREAREESGMAEFRLVEPGIFDLDIHAIPERKGIPEHLHYDVRFLLEASQTAFVVSDESLDLAWVPLADLQDYSTEPSMLRMRDKSLL